MESDDDDTLLERHRHGDREAFAELVVRYRKPVYNAAFWILRRSEDASDITQIVFLKVVERLDDYNPQYKFFSWLYRIAVNESLNWQRRQSHEDALPEDFDAPDFDTATPEQQLDQNQRARQLQVAMMSMSVNDRTVLTMRHFAELSYDDMAMVLQLDVKTVKSRLFDARARLRKLLAKQGMH